MDCSGLYSAELVYHIHVLDPERSRSEVGTNHRPSLAAPPKRKRKKKIRVRSSKSLACGNQTKHGFRLFFFLP